MATIPHHSTTHLRPNRRHSLDYSTLPSYTSSSIRHPSTTISHHAFYLSTTTTTTSTTSTTTAAASATSSSTTSNTGYTLDTLELHLAAQNFRQADEETRRLLIVLAGDAAVKRGYVFFSEVQFIPKQELQAIDELWKKFSNGRFGYGIQRKIWLKCNKDFTRFFISVGWMKKLDTEIVQYNYRSFPSEFIWEVDNGEQNGVDEDGNSSDKIPAPEGHLPLTNALRGTQLLNCILTHPAFVDDEEKQEGDEESDGQSGGVDEVEKKKSRLASLRDKLFKPNYSF